MTIQRLCLIFALTLALILSTVSVFGGRFEAAQADPDKVASPGGTTLEPVGQAGGPTYSVVVAGQYAYVAEGASLAVLDVSNPAQPQRVGYTLLPYQTSDVFVSGDYAYVTASTAGLRVIDVSDPTRPLEVGHYELYQYALSVHVVDDYAYVINSAPGFRTLQTLDVSDPTQPTWVGSCSLSLHAKSLYVVDGYAYLANGPKGLQIVSLADPANPSPVGGYDAARVDDVYVSGEYAYVAAGSEGLRVLDVSDPAQPTLVGTYATSQANGVAVSGGYAYLASDDGLEVLSLADPAHPDLLGAYTAWESSGVYVAGDYAYVISDAFLSAGYLRVVSVADKAQPSEVAARLAFIDMESVYAAGSYACVTDLSLGLGVVSLLDPATPTLVGVWDEPELARDVHVAGDYAYVIDNEWISPAQTAGKLWVVDLSDPAQPTSVGLYQTSGTMSDVFIAGDYAYVVRWDSLRVISLADPVNPVEVGALDGLDSPQKVYVEGDYAYVTGGYDGLHIISVSDPTRPTRVSLLDTQDYARGVYVSGDHAYVADDEGLAIVSLADPANPTQVSYHETPGQATRVHVVGEYAFVADGYTGLRLISVADPSHPVELAFYDAGGATDVFVDEDHIYIADRQNGLITLRLTQSSTVSGQLSDGAGNPVAGAHVTAGGLYSATTDASGVYTLTAPAGTYTLTPSTPGYFWSPPVRTVILPPDASGQDFVGHHVQKGAIPSSQTGNVGLGDRLTYSLRLVWPQDGELGLYDPLPPLTYTRYLSGSLAGPGLGYDSEAHAISGSLDVTAGQVVTVTFALQVEVEGTAGFAPTLINRACVYPAGAGLDGCHWSNRVVHFTYRWPLYLPVVQR